MEFLYLRENETSEERKEGAASDSVPTLDEVLQQIQASGAPLAWKKACEHIARKIGSGAYISWISPLKPQELSNNGVTLLAPDSFIRDWVKQYHLDHIEGALAKVMVDLKPRSVLIVA